MLPRPALGWHRNRTRLGGASPRTHRLFLKTRKSRLADPKPRPRQCISGPPPRTPPCLHQGESSVAGLVYQSYLRGGAPFITQRHALHKSCYTMVQNKTLKTNNHINSNNKSQSMTNTVRNTRVLFEHFEILICTCTACVDLGNPLRLAQANPPVAHTTPKSSNSFSSIPNDG